MLLYGWCIFKAMDTFSLLSWLVYELIGALFCFRSFPGIFGTQQEHYMQVIKQMLWQCLQDQSSQQVNLSPAICCFSTWQGFCYQQISWLHVRSATIQFITIGYHIKCHDMVHNTGTCNWQVMSSYSFLTVLESSIHNKPWTDGPCVFSMGTQDCVSLQLIGTVCAFVPPSWKICDRKHAKQCKGKKLDFFPFPRSLCLINSSER